MPHLRALVRLHDPNDLTGEFSVQNTLYYNQEPQGVASFNSIAEDIVSAYQTNVSWLPDPYDAIQVKLYDMADSEPRTPKHIETASISSNGVSGPHEVACCLSYYCDQNQPRKRGRIFIGPFAGAHTSVSRPSSALRASIMQLAQQLYDVGGIDAFMELHSPTDNDFKRISHFWVDDAWDTVRSRGVRPTTRTAAAGTTP